MTLTTVYHGTPSLFTQLQKGSWVSDSIYEAALHLFLKNIANKETDLLSGWVIQFDNFNLDACLINVDLGDTLNIVTQSIIEVDDHKRRPLMEVVGSFPLHLKMVFTDSSEIIDLTPLLNEEE